MSKMIYRLIALCLLSVSLTMFAQSGDSMKQEQSQPDQMKHDNDGMKHDDSMKHDEMKNDKKTKKNKKTKDSMNHDDSMKHKDQMKHDDKPNRN